MNGFLLFRGLTETNLKTLFETLDLGSPKFTDKDFVAMYHKYSGHNEEDFAQKDKCKYNYLFIERDPTATIMLNLETVLK